MQRIFCALFLVLLFSPAADRLSAAGQPATVLVLNSYHQGYEWSDAEIAGLLEGFEGSAPGASVMIEHLDFKRFPDEGHSGRVAGFLAEKYSGRNIDLAIALDNPALLLLLSRRARLLPGVPVVFAGINDFRPELLDGHTGVTGVAEIMDSRGTIELALALHPGTRRVLAVHDYTGSGLAIRNEMEPLLPLLRERVSIDFNRPLTYAETAQQIAELAPESLVLILSFTTDREGLSLSTADSTRALTERAGVPVYAMHATRLGHGIVGGVLISGGEQGRRAAGIARRILAGEDPAAIPVDMRPSSVPMFDYGQLKRFRISEAALPPGSQVLNRPVSFIELHGNVFWPATGVTAALLLLVVQLAALLSQKARSERQLRESEANLRRLVDHAPDAIYIQTSGRIRYANPAAVRLFKCESAEQLVGRPMLDLVDASSRDSVSARMRALDSRQPVPLAAHKYLRLDGRSVEVQTAAVPFRYQGSDGALVFARDISDQRNLEGQLVQAQKMEAIGTLAGGIAHDFNNILSVIIGNAEILDFSEAFSENERKGVGQILSASRRARDLVRQILAFSRHSRQEKMLINLKPIVKETLEFLRASLPASIELQQFIAYEAGTVMADPTQVQQVLVNLCTNAAQAMEIEGGVLRIELNNARVSEQDVRADLDAEPGDYLMLTVMDTGQGMKPDVLDRIFDPFFTTKDPEKGTGLGLSVVHGIVKSHGGIIRVFSQPGKGTTFKLFWPRAEGFELPGEAAERPMPSGSERILLVDDEKALAELGRQLLGSLGYQVDIRTSPIEALEAFRAGPEKYALVITDLSMPQMTGLKLARKLVEARADIPIVMCTGFSDQADEANARAIGVRAFLSKPMLMRELAETVRKVLDDDRHRGSGV